MVRLHNRQFASIVAKRQGLAGLPGIGNIIGGGGGGGNSGNGDPGDSPVGIVNSIIAGLPTLPPLIPRPSSSSTSSTPSSSPSSSSSSSTPVSSSSAPTSSTPSSTASSTTPTPTPTPIPTPTLSPSPPPTSSPTPTQPPSSPSDVNVNVTVTSHIPAPSSSTTQTSNSKSFFQNTPLEAGVFSVAGVIVLVLLIIAGTYALRKRRRSRLDREFDDAVDFAPPTSHLVGGGDADEEEARGSGGLGSLRPSFSNSNSSGGDMRQVQMPAGPSAAYAPGQMGPDPGQGVGQTYGNGVYAYYDAPPSPSPQFSGLAPAPPRMPYPAFDSFRNQTPAPRQQMMVNNSEMMASNPANEYARPQLAAATGPPPPTNSNSTYSSTSYSSDDPLPVPTGFTHGASPSGSSFDIAGAGQVQVVRKVSLTRAHASTVMRKPSQRDEKPKLPVSPMLPEAFGEPRDKRPPSVASTVYDNEEDAYGGVLKVVNA